MDFTIVVTEKTIERCLRSWSLDKRVLAMLVRVLQDQVKELEKQLLGRTSRGGDG